MPRRYGSITVPQELKNAIGARAAALDLPVSRYVRHLLRNDQIRPQRGLAAVIKALSPSKYTYAHIPLSLPKQLRGDAEKSAKAARLEFSPYVVALALRDTAYPRRPFVILPMPMPITARVPH